MCKYIEIECEWNRAVAIDYHNIDSAPEVRTTSIDSLPLNFTDLGNLVKQAKYSNNDFAISEIARRAVGVTELLQPIEKIYYVPSRDSRSLISVRVANALCQNLELVKPDQAFDWKLFLNYQKGMDKRDVEKIVESALINNGFRRHTLKTNILILDDTLWSGSTIHLAYTFLKAFYDEAGIKILCLTKIRDDYTGHKMLPFTKKEEL